MEREEGATDTRLFVAIPITGSSANELADYVETVRPLAADVRWTVPQNYHITLAFLGECPSARIPHAIDAITRGAEATPVFDLTFARLDGFPDRNEPRVVWADISEGATELRDLQSRVAGELEKVGHARDTRGYTPHLTLGHMSPDADHNTVSHLLATAADVDVRVAVDQAWLFSSSWKDQDNRPSYKQLAAINLA